MAEIGGKNGGISSECAIRIHEHVNSVPERERKGKREVDGWMDGWMDGERKEIYKEIDGGRQTETAARPLRHGQKKHPCRQCEERRSVQPEEESESEGEERGEGEGEGGEGGDGRAHSLIQFITIFLKPVHDGSIFTFSPGYR